MFRSQTLTKFVCAALSFGMLLQGNVVSGFEENEPKPLVQDVELKEGGVLETRVIDVYGNSLSGQEVVIQFKGKAVASAFSDDKGLVTVSDLRPGMHLITTSAGSTPCRFWSSGDAPPSAVAIPAVIAGTDAEIVRGQFGMFNLPMIVYAGVTAAAMVIAIDANQENDDLEKRIRKLEASP
ncbi:MAG: hypothetical protein ACK58L_02920 [Planctomycetota bacterium]